MTPEKQRIAIAEACPLLVTVGPYSPTTFFYRRGLHIEEFDPLNDLNAMREAIETLRGTPAFDVFFELLDDECGCISGMVLSRASQQAKCFLHAIGKWEESA